MRSLPDRLNAQLDDLIALRSGKTLSGQSPTPAPRASDEIDSLVAIAQHIQGTLLRQVDPLFAWDLEQRILSHHAALQRQRSTKNKGFRFFQPSVLRTQLAVGVALLFMLLLGTASALTVAARVTNPTNPLYSVKRWEQGIQHSLTTSSIDRAELDWQIAHDQLTALANLANPAHATAYRQGLADLDQQINTLAQAVGGLPSGQDQDRLSNQLATLKAEARSTLHRLLPQLAMPERLVTTTELGHLGDSVPHLNGAILSLPMHGRQKQATITLSGSNILPGAQILMDNRLVVSIGTFQNGTYIFVVNWEGKESPKTISILNPDGTAAQTTAITLTISDDNGNGNSGGDTNSNSSGNSHGHGNGNGGHN